ncbi:MAG: SPASM domain-containing protein, partial [Candidatus Zixiibacteriota bacterium]
ITLDGPERIHNKRRALKNGKDSFKQILANMQYAATKLFVSLRINVDKAIEESAIEELLLELKAAGLEQKISIYFGQLEPATTVCSNIADNCYNSVDFSEVEIEYFRLLQHHGFKIEKLPSPVSAFCLAQRVNAFVIDHEGYLYRCFNYAGDAERAMGNITSPIDYQHPNFTRLFDFNAFESDKCRSCSILPVCLGGCPSQRIDRNLTEDELCQGWRHNLKPMLEVIACSRQQKLQSAIKERI